MELKIRSEAKNPESRKYMLIQHTEHIHFQAHEKGACLRGTEVKPKLDKFIYNFCKKNNIVLPKSCYLKQPGEELKALNYSISIYPVNTSADSGNPKFNTPRTGNTAYFGNEGNKEKEDVKRDSVLYKDGLTMEIHCRDQRFQVQAGELSFCSLMELIDYVLPAFFTLTCFGTRSTKGFGSYEIRERKKELPKDKVYLLQFVPVIYYLTFNDNDKSGEMLEIIKIISNMMKAGLNYSFKNRNDDPPDDFYYKGRIFRYYTANGVGSDKAFMKQRVIPGKDNSPESEETKSYSEFFYNRGILGLAPLYEFRSGKKTTREGTVIVEDGGPGKVKIERFNNPIHFKPNGNTLLIIPTDIPEIMGSRTFTFTYGKNPPEKLPTPAVKKKGADPKQGEFNLVMFLDYFMKEFNNRTDMMVSHGKKRPKIMFKVLSDNGKLVTMSKVGV